MFSRAKQGSRQTGSVPHAAPSIIGGDLRIVGDLVSEGEIQIDGSVDGDIRAKVLLVGEAAFVKGELVAELVTVHGTVHGQIKAREVTLAKTARMTGDIMHERLAIEQGAFLEGHCRHMVVAAEVAREVEAPDIGDGRSETGADDGE